MDLWCIIYDTKIRMKQLFSFLLFSQWIQCLVTVNNSPQPRWKSIITIIEDNYESSRTCWESMMTIFACVNMRVQLLEDPLFLICSNLNWNDLFFHGIDLILFCPHWSNMWCDTRIGSLVLFHCNMRHTKQERRSRM